MSLLSFIKQLFGGGNGTKVQSITPSEAQANLHQGIVLIDVRQPNELKSDGKIKRAKNIPLGNLTEASLPNDKTKPIMFICRSGARSSVASKQAVRYGYEQVLNVQGGIMNWKNAGLPTD